MREAMLIVPRRDNDGLPLDTVKRKAIKMLTKAFGGVTESAGKGCYTLKSGRVDCEPVWLLMSACEESAAADETLRKIARYIATAGRQESVYCRLPNGRVEFISTGEEEKWTLSRPLASSKESANMPSPIASL